MDTLAVRVETRSGLTGWGEGFGFRLCATTRHALETLVAPAAIGLDAADIAGTMATLHRRLHNFGRNGPVSFALSALDIALWDIAAQAAGKPLHALLGSAARPSVEAYASLLRYGDPGLVRENVQRALALGYRQIKLHEVDLDCIRAARDAAPPEVPLMLDLNCRFDTVSEAVAFCREVAGMNIAWVEEPFWPPEGYQPIAEVRRAAGVPIAAGECLGNAAAIGTMLGRNAVDVVQPSVTKCGGVSAVQEVVALAAKRRLRCVPHSPYFGPGLLATLHILAASPSEEPLEVYFVDLERPPYPALIPVDGRVPVPRGPGLGLALCAEALAAAE